MKKSQRMATTLTLTENIGTCDNITGCTITLPFAPVTGQLDLQDPNFGNLVLDVITFDNSTSTATFASDNIDGFDDPGDTFGPPPPLANVINLTEPPSNVLTYSPQPGQPGYTLDGSGAPVTYGVTSDSTPESVPEPSSLLLLGSGLLGMVGAMRRKLLS
jgi:hypothetical protein